MKKNTLLLLILILVSHISKAQVFSTTSIAPFNTANFYSRVIDFDNDGDDDIYGFNSSTTQNSTKLYRNNGNSTFTDVSTITNFPTFNYGICADLDKNGFMDLYYVNGDTLRYTLNNGTTFSSPSVTCGYVLLSTLFNTAYTNIKSYKLGDFNGDGIYDIIVHRVVGTSSAILGKQGQLNCSGCFFGFSASPAVSLITLSNTTLTQMQFNDVDNDSDFDILTCQGNDQYSNSVYALYINNAGNFSLLTTSGYNVGRLNGFGISGEFNNDGKSDIISGAADCCVAGNPLYVYFSNSTSTSFTASTTAMTRVNNPYYNIASIVDINLDKKQDIVWTSITAIGSEVLQCYLNNGNNTFTESAASLGINFGPSAGLCCPIQNGMYALMLDLNNDKKPDLDIHEQDWVAPYTVVNSTQRINTSTNNAVKLKLIACSGLREGWGARVRYKCGGAWSYQQHTSYTGVNYPFLYLGMGTSTVVDSIVVNWMGGGISVLTNVSAGSYQVISENTNCTNIGGAISAVATANGPTTFCQGANVVLNANSGAGLSYQWKNNGVNINGATSSTYTATASGSYTVTITNSSGCTGTSSIISITVNPLPLINAGPDQTICSGTFTTLTGTGAASYTWDNGVVNGVAFTPSVTSTYTLTGTASNGCTNTDQVLIIVNQSPNIYAGPDQAICEGSSVTLSGSGGTNYAWSNAITNGVSFVPVFTNTYTVTGTNSNGCTNTDQVTITVNENGFITIDDMAIDTYTLNGITYTQSGSYTQVIPTVAGCDSIITLNLSLSYTELSELSNDVRIYPNPTRDVLHIEGVKLDDVLYEVLDASGRIVRQGHFELNSINLASLQAGTYMLKFLNIAKPLRFVKE
jgi:hypothetical protein